MKRCISLIFISAFAVLIILQGNLKAAEVSVGATTWYSWWKMQTSGSDGNKDIDPAFLYGPALSVKFNNDYNLTFVFLYGKFGMKQETTTEEIARYDSDLALNYRIGNYFKIFAGAKYMGYEMTEFHHRGIGPGAGISVVLPVGSNFFLLGNVSALYLWGKHEQNNQSTGTTKTDYNEYGTNTSLSLAYYIESSSVTLSLGGRYQYFRSDFESDDPNNSDMDHHFYGITAAATYSFSI